ncbi:MAG: hypothetical protein NNA18_05705 [Nitrospira sp.]|nr:hypothetical protein [Nitrospira sp.]
MIARAAMACCLTVVMAASLWAGEPEPFPPASSFRQAISSSELRSFLNKALDHLENVLELSAELTSDDTTGNRKGRLQLKVYPEGKEKAEQHFWAEGWFQLGSDYSLKDFSLRLHNSVQQSESSTLQSNDIL